MRTLLALRPSALAVPALLAGAAGAQAEWTHQAPLPTGLHVRDVWVRSAEEAWIVSEGGRLSRTLDGGLTWEVQDLATDSLNELFFLDDDHGWAVGNAVFRTLDGGATWTKSPTVLGSVYGVHFVDPLHGWISGSGVVYRSTDGGATWTIATLPESGVCHGVFFHDPLRGWATNISGELFATEDGGATWTLAASFPTYNLNTIWFEDEASGWLVGSDLVLRTADRGATWQALELPAGTWGYEAAFLPGGAAWLVGEGSNVVATVDGWQTATTQLPPGSGPRLAGVAFADATFGLAVGEEGRILVTGDGGATWLQRDSSGIDVHGLDVNDPAHAWVAMERGTVARTANGGAQWISSPVAGFSVYGSIQDVEFLDDDRTGWAAGWDQTFGATTGRISRSDDGGRTWQVQYAQIDHFLYAVEAVDADTVVACGLRPFSPDTMVRTTDGGATWSSVGAGLGVFFDVDFPDPQHGFAVGGRIAATTDGGATWSTQLTPTYSLEAVDFSDPLHGWAVGWWGTALRTVDGGATWTPLTHPLLSSENVLTDVSAVDASTAWVTGPQGFVARTVDGGATWTQEAVPTGGASYLPSFTCAEFLDADFGWIGGGPRVDAGGPWLRELGPPPGFALRNGRMARGRSVAVTTTGATPGDVLLLGLSTAGYGPGPCAGTACLELLPPIVTLGAGVADAAGAWELVLDVPPTAPFVEVHLQAVRPTGDPDLPFTATNATSTPIEP